MEPFLQESSQKQDKQKELQESSEIEEDEDPPIKKSRLEDEITDPLMHKSPEEDERDSPQDELSEFDLLSDFVEKVKSNKSVMLTNTKLTT
jgi:hypothetical protein